MISEFPPVTPEVLDITQIPGAVVTTLTQISELVLIVGLIALVGGFFIGRSVEKKTHK